MDLWSQHKPLEEDYAWQLFNLADDPIEIHDLAAARSDKLSELIVLWGQYERDYAVIVPRTALTRRNRACQRNSLTTDRIWQRARSL